MATYRRGRALVSEDLGSSNGEELTSAEMKLSTSRPLWPAIKFILIFAIPIVLLPLPLIAKDDVATFGYCLLIVASFWILELLPIFVTSLLPMVLLPITGLAQPAVLAKQYFPDSCMLFLGTLERIFIKEVKRHNVWLIIWSQTLCVYKSLLRSSLTGSSSHPKNQITRKASPEHAEHFRRQLQKSPLRTYDSLLVPVYVDF